MPFKFPTSFHEQQSLLPASGRMLLCGGLGERPMGAGPKLHPDSDNHLGLLHIT